MATGPEHYHAAEMLRAKAGEWMDADIGWKANLSVQERLAFRTADLADAQVHATLALAAAVGTYGVAEETRTAADANAWEHSAGEYTAQKRRRTAAPEASTDGA